MEESCNRSSELQRKGEIELTRVFVVVVDGCGVWSTRECPSTIATVCLLTDSHPEKELPNLWSIGLDDAVKGKYNVMMPHSTSAGSFEGHREMFGFPMVCEFCSPIDPVPKWILDAFADATGCRCIGNLRGRGAEILPILWKEHISTGSPILYRGLDSVVVMAAETSVMLPQALYDHAYVMRQLLSASYPVKKLIVRPLLNGVPVEDLRRDFYLHCSGVSPSLSRIPRNWTLIVNAKVATILCPSDCQVHATSSDPDCLNTLREYSQQSTGHICLIFNLEDFDRFAHGGDVAGCWQCLVQFDRFLSSWKQNAGVDDWLLVTADHGVRVGEGDLGNSHILEGVPLLCMHGREPIRQIPIHEGFGIIGESIRQIMDIGFPNVLIGKQ